MIIYTSITHIMYFIPQVDIHLLANNKYIESLQSVTEFNVQNFLTHLNIAIKYCKYLNCFNLHFLEQQIFWCFPEAHCHSLKTLLSLGHISL